MSAENKIKTLEELKEIVSAFGADGKKVVMCHGVFDLLHIGHIRYLKQAQKLGDVLIVTVTQDHNVNKGPHLPAFTENLRLESLAALECVDYVALNQRPTAVEAIRILRPHVYAKGAEYRQNRTEEIKQEEICVESIGGNVELIDDITSSSTYLANRYTDLFSEEVKMYLDDFRERYSVEKILGYLEKIKKLKVLVIGDAIIDEYQYCEAMGKSSKEPSLAVKYL